MSDQLPLIDPAGPLGFAFSGRSSALLGWDDPEWLREQAAAERMTAAIRPYEGPGAVRLLWRTRGRVRPFGGTAYRPGHGRALAAWMRRNGLEVWVVAVEWQLGLFVAA